MEFFKRNYFFRVVFPSVLVLMLFVASPVSFSEPANLGLVKAELMQYHDTGEYYKDISSVITRAVYYLNFRVVQNQRLEKPRKLAVVLDIDETALTNYPDMMRLHFGGTMKEVGALEAVGDDSAIPCTVELHKDAIDHDVAVFFISGRREYERQATEENLKQAGYHHWAHIYLRANTDYRKASRYKTAIRKQLVKQGYDIVLNVGDQESDLSGGFSDMTFKLPNPYYLVS